MMHYDAVMMRYDMCAWDCVGVDMTIMNSQSEYVCHTCIYMHLLTSVGTFRDIVDALTSTSSQTL